MAAIAWCGALLGSLNLFLDGALPTQGPGRFAYAGALVVCVAVGTLMLVRPDVWRRAPLAVVLVADLLYAVVVLSVADAERQAPPLMLLFATVLAAWLLSGWALGVHLVLVYALCWLALAPTAVDVPHLVVEVVVQGTVLVVATLVVFRLRRRAERLVAAMHRVSSTDPLTGLSNRRHLEELAPQWWAGTRAQGLLVVALVLDLDRFKEVNDRYGHAVGDDVLVAVAGAVSAVVRSGDVVARTGGEEIVVLTGAGDRREATAMAERVRHAVASCAAPVPPTVSVGVAVGGEAVPVDPVAQTWRLIDAADAAMYEAKEGGRNRVAVAAPGA